MFCLKQHFEITRRKIKYKSKQMNRYQVHRFYAQTMGILRIFRIF